MKLNYKRAKFFLGHLLISVFIASLVLLVVFKLWYPAPLAEAVGVTKIFLMMLIIDVIVGPILGFIVYKESKKTLKIDLTIIILIQVAALVYGLYSIEKGRPVYIVYNIDRFELVRKNEIVNNESLQIGNIGLSPNYVAVKYPEDIKLREKVMFDEVFGGVSLSQRPEYYQSLENMQNQIKLKTQNLNNLVHFNNEARVEEILKKYPNADAWLPLKANTVDMVVLMKKETAEVIKIVDLRPWE